MAKKESIREKIHNFNSDMEFCIYKDLNNWWYIFLVPFIILVLVGVILAASPALVIIFGMFVFIWKMLSTSMENEQEAAFYDDYMEIIDEMIEDKEKTEKSDTYLPGFGLSIQTFQLRRYP